ncbi:HEPN domain-containing protein [candidate division KSB1 bacterium]|nr:HEPN domain-containing protein [candidate division KSB1 bacterium]
MDDKAQLQTQLEMMIQKAYRSLASTQTLISSADYDFASSRAYYAVFYAIEAMLLTKQLSFSKHAGVIAAFNQHFIKSGVFPKEFSKMLERLFRNRQMGDYGYEPPLSAEETEEDLRVAQRIVDSIAEHLRQNGFLKFRA